MAGHKVRSKGISLDSTGTTHRRKILVPCENKATKFSTSQLTNPERKNRLKTPN